MKPESRGYQVGQYSQLELAIDGLGYRGEGYASLPDGRFISVPKTLPGDRVAVRVGDFVRGRAFAEIEAWLRRSPEHVDPLCPHYWRCTGCSLRHLSDASERDFKLAASRQILRKFGPVGADAIELDWLDPGLRVGHRVRGRFLVEPSEDRLLVGLRSTSLAGGLTDVRDCPAQSKTFLATLSSLLEVLECPENLPHCHPLESIEILSNDDLVDPNSSPADGPKALVVLHCKQPLEQGLESRLLSFAIGAHVGLALSKSEAGLGVLQDKPTLTLALSVAGQGNPSQEGWEANPAPRGPTQPLSTFISVAVPYGSWYSAVPRASRELDGWLHERSILQGEGTLLDACCGIGSMSISFLRRARRIWAIDKDRSAILALTKAIEENGLDTIQTRTGMLERILYKLRRDIHSLPQPSSAIINPMRSPLGYASLRHLAPLELEQILYLGPAAVSAARDSAVLRELGYEIVRGATVNHHPATSQIMLALDMRRN